MVRPGDGLALRPLCLFASLSAPDELAAAAAAADDDEAASSERARFDPDWGASTLPLDPVEDASAPAGTDTPSSVDVAAVGPGREGLCDMAGGRMDASGGGVR